MKGFTFSPSGRRRDEGAKIIFTLTSILSHQGRGRI
jgi:hypothetical protein